MRKIGYQFKNRAAEPSTYAGVAAMIAIALQFIPPQYQAIAGAFGALFGAIAAFRRDQSAPDHPDNNFNIP